MLLALIILVLGKIVTTLNFKIGVITEGGQVNRSLIEVAFARRVNSNWRVLQAHTLSYVHVNVSWCSSQQAVRTGCSEIGLSGLIGVGSCSLLDEVSSLSKSLQLPLIAVPTGLCDSAHLLKDFTVLGNVKSEALISAAASVISSDSAVSNVAILFDWMHGNTFVQKLQNRLTSAGVSSLTFQVDNTANASVTHDLVHHLKRLVKKRLFKLVLLATPHNVLSVLRLANEAAVLQQNYFWLVLDTGLTKADVLSVTPANANVALLRGGVFGECTAAVMDVFPHCQLDWVRTLDARFVDAVEAMAKALNDSLVDPGFSPSNATCAPLQPWTSGSTVLNRLISISNYDTHRGLISFNSSSRHFSSQGVEVVASYNDLWSSPMSMLKSAQFDASSGALSKLFRYKGVSLAFPNTFMGFKNQTIITCTPESDPMTVFRKIYPNNTVEMSGMTLDILNYLASRLDFRFITKNPNDGSWGAPQANSEFYTGCVGELQRGLVSIGAGPFTKTAGRDSVIDFSAALFQESNGVLVPNPGRKSAIWNVFTPFSRYVWIAIIGAMVAAAILTWLLAYFSPFTGYNLGLNYAIGDEIWVKEYLWTFVGSLLQQGQDFYPSATSARVALASWWLFVVIMNGCFVGNLTAYLTATVSEEPINTLNGLLSQSAVKLYVQNGTNLYTLLTESRSGIYKDITDKMVVYSPYENCPSNPPRTDQACISDYTALLALALRNCSKFYMASEQFNTGTVAFMFPEDAPYADLFNFHLQKLYEAGLIDRWFQNYWSSDAVCTKSLTSEADPISLEGIGGCCIVAASFYAAGIVMLLLELFWIKVVGKEPTDCLLF